MTEKRFKLRLSKLGNGMITDTQKKEDLYFDKEFLDATLPKTNEWLNELADENEHYKSIFFELIETALTDMNCRELYCKGILDIFKEANSLNQARENDKGAFRMTEITVKVNTRELTRQLNDLDLLQYQFKPNELEEFIKENLKVVEIGSSEDIRFYLSLKKMESIE